MTWANSDHESMGAIDFWFVDFKFEYKFYREIGKKERLIYVFFGFSHLILKVNLSKKRV